MARRTNQPVDLAQPADDAPALDSVVEPTAEGMDAVGESTPEPAKAVKPKTGRTLAIGVVLGIGAAALGYGAALKFPLATLASAPADNSAALAELAAKIDAIDLSGIESRLSALETAPAVATVDLAPLQDQITALAQKLAAVPANDDLRAELSALAARVAQSDPAPAIKAAIAAEMAAVQRAAQDMAAAVTDAAKDAQQNAALTQLRAALDTGGPFAAAAKSLALPDVLAQHAATGIPSLTALRDGFADAARAGLDAALRADMGQTWGDRVANFLRTQTGARSLTPREGNDPDAILSRVEVGLRSADLAGAIAEIDALPDAAKAAMQGWIDQLRLRTDALSAYELLTKEGM